MGRQEIVTAALSADLLRESVSEIARLLCLWAYEHINVIYGFRCNLPMDELWHPIEIASEKLDPFVERSVRDGIFRFGWSDLHIQDQQETLEFKLCHESDVHFMSSDQGLVDEVIRLWRGKGVGVHINTTPGNSAGWISVE